jgi:5-methylcytosine-specific restriction endonuclease McrBC regulatory subunit McrC
LKQKGLTTLINEFEQYDKYLESMGVLPYVDLNMIENIRYTRMNAPYLSVMNLSKSILMHIKAESAHEGTQNGCSYFIDIAELWEMYLLKVLQRNLPSCYRVYSPNTHHGDFLLHHEMREIRPDIIIEKDGRILAIIDAKYKPYRYFGKTSLERIFVQREDLYQMSTYLYHYGTRDKPILGLFSSPVKSEKNDIHTFSRNQNHQIGLINLDIESADGNIPDIHLEEVSYAKTISNLLKTL